MSDKKFLKNLKKIKRDKKVAKGSDKFSKKVKNRKASVVLSDEILEVINDLNNKPEHTYPHMEYCKDGDVLNIDLEDIFSLDYYADWIGSYKEKGGQAHSISVIKQQKTNKVVGFEIWGLLSFLKENNVSLEQRYGKCKKKCTETPRNYSDSGGGDNSGGRGDTYSGPSNGPVQCGPSGLA